jgi:transposase
VPAKSEHQQEISCLHRIRERLIKNKTAMSHQARGLLSEFSVVFSCAHKALLIGLSRVMDNFNTATDYKIWG